MLLVERHKADMLLIKEEVDFAGSATTMLSNDEVGNILAFGVGVVVIFAIEEGYDIGVLLDGARFAKIGQEWDLRAARFDCTRKLRQCNDGDVHFPSYQLKPA